MTEPVKKAVADVMRTMREIRESSAPAPVRHEQGDFFTFSTPGRSTAHQDTKPTPEPVSTEPVIRR